MYSKIVIYLKENWTFLYKILKSTKILIYKFRSQEKIFTATYLNNSWGGVNSVSGTGSDSEHTQVLVTGLESLIKKYSITTLIDAPCGDLNWIKQLFNKFDKYLGVDIVKPLIDDNRKKFGSEKINFTHHDLRTFNFPAYDLILCRDCFIHLPFNNIFEILARFKESGSRYVLMTTCPAITENPDIVMGEFRRVNYCISPFSLPEPLDLIDEKCTIPTDRDKFLGLWDLSKI